MRWSLLTIRIVIALISIATAILLILTVAPLATGGLRIEMPRDQDVQWGLEGNIVHAEVPVRIFNGGYLDIEDFQLSVNMTDADGTLLSHSSSPAMDLVKDRWTEVVLPIDLNLDDISLAKKADIVFNGTEVFLGVGLDSYFGMRTMHVTIDGASDQGIKIPALITDLNIDPADLSLVQAGSGYDLVMPYGFSASDLVAGRSIDLTATIRDGSGVLGTVTESFLIQRNNQREIHIPLSAATVQKLLSTNDTLNIEGKAIFEGLTMTRSVHYDWTAPIRNVVIEGASIVSNRLALNYAFDASVPLVGQNAQMTITVTDAVGPIGQGTESFIIGTSNHRAVMMDVAPATALRLIGHPGDWQVTVTFAVNGMTTTMVRTYHWNGGV